MSSSIDSFRRGSTLTTLPSEVHKNIASFMKSKDIASMALVSKGCSIYSVAPLGIANKLKEGKFFNRKINILANNLTDAASFVVYLDFWSQFHFVNPIAARNQELVWRQHQTIRSRLKSRDLYLSRKDFNQIKEEFAPHKNLKSAIGSLPRETDLCEERRRMFENLLEKIYHVVFDVNNYVDDFSASLNMELPGIQPDKLEVFKKKIAEFSKEEAGDGSALHQGLLAVAAEDQDGAGQPGLYRKNNSIFDILVEKHVRASGPGGEAAAGANVEELLVHVPAMGDVHHMLMNIAAKAARADIKGGRSVEIVAKEKGIRRNSPAYANLIATAVYSGSVGRAAHEGGDIRRIAAQAGIPLYDKDASQWHEHLMLLSIHGETGNSVTNGEKPIDAARRVGIDLESGDYDILAMKAIPEALRTYRKRHDLKSFGFRPGSAAAEKLLREIVNLEIRTKFGQSDEADYSAAQILSLMRNVRWALGDDGKRKSKYYNVFSKYDQELMKERRAMRAGSSVEEDELVVGYLGLGPRSLTHRRMKAAMDERPTRSDADDGFYKGDVPIRLAGMPYPIPSHEAFPDEADDDIDPEEAGAQDHYDGDVPAGFAHAFNATESDSEPPAVSDDDIDLQATDSENDAYDGDVSAGRAGTPGIGELDAGYFKDPDGLGILKQVIDEQNAEHSGSRKRRRDGG